MPCNDNQLKGTRDGPKKHRKNRVSTNIFASKNQSNAPLNTINLPDDLSFKLNRISGDTGSSNRLFTIILTTKNGALQLNSNELFFNQSVNEPIQVIFALVIIASFNCQLTFMSYSFKKIVYMKLMIILNYQLI